MSKPTAWQIMTALICLETGLPSCGNCYYHYKGCRRAAGADAVDMMKTQVVRIRELEDKAQEAMLYLANGGGACDICAHDDICKEVEGDCDLACEWCERIEGTACAECITGKKWENFQWNGKTGKEEALHE